MGSVEHIQPRLDADPAYRDDLLADIPENVMDLWRDKPAAAGGTLYALPPDSNCQLQYYRGDVFEAAGFDGPADTWDDAIEIAKTLAESGAKQTGTTLKRGLYAGTTFSTMLHCFGGDWFDKLEKGFYNPTVNSDAGFAALDTLQKLAPYFEDTTLNASDDEANPLMANGTWTFAPLQWGGTTMNDPAYTEFADVWKTAPVPKGNVEGGDHRPHMGGLGMLDPRLLQEQGRRLGVHQVLLLRQQSGPGDRQGLGRKHRPARPRLAPPGVRADPRPLPGHPGLAADRGSLSRPDGHDRNV